jgi:hypothetical protein
LTKCRFSRPPRGPHPELSIGLSSATQGRYQSQQALLDITQGARTSAAAYDERDPATVDFLQTIVGARLFGWPDVLARAGTARAEIEPGLLASSIPGGVAYVGVRGRKQREAIAAADREGTIATARTERAAAVAETARKLLRDHRLVVVGLATGENGDEALRRLIRARAPDELLIVIQTPPRSRAPQLLPIGVAGLGTPGALTSSTTHQRGLVAGIDIPATILDHLGLDVPGEMKGQVMKHDGARDAADLNDLSARLRVVAPRRFPALETMLAGWLALLLVCAVFWDQRGVRAAQRIGALQFCWLLPVLLVTAWLAPSRDGELALVALGTLGLALLTDRLVAWPRAIGVPCAVAVVTYVVDLARGSDLIVRSLLGPNPRFGSRFYGIGNELEATLPVLLFIAMAVLLYGRGALAQRRDRLRRRRPAAGRGDGLGAPRGRRRRRPDDRRRNRRLRAVDAARGDHQARDRAGDRDARRGARRACRAGPRHRRRQPLHALGPARRRRRRAVGHDLAPLHAGVQRLQARADAVRDRDRRAGRRLRRALPRTGVRAAAPGRGLDGGVVGQPRSRHRRQRLQRLRPDVAALQHIRARDRRDVRKRRLGGADGGDSDGGGPPFGFPHCFQAGGWVACTGRACASPWSRRIRGRIRAASRDTSRRSERELLETGHHVRVLAPFDPPDRLATRLHRGRARAPCPARLRS